jgi:hypothetical protein
MTDVKIAHKYMETAVGFYCIHFFKLRLISVFEVQVSVCLISCKFLCFIEYYIG